MKICTNNSDFYKYLQTKFCNVVFYDKPLAGYYNVFFSEQRHTLVSGNAHNKERILSGDFKRDCDEFVKLFEQGADIVLTGVTMLMGSKHDKYAHTSCKRGKALGITRQRIHTSELGEVVCPRYIQLWSRDNSKLNSIAVKASDNIIPYGYMGKSQSHKDLEVWSHVHDKDERHKRRYVPEYALYSQLYHQFIKGEAK